MINNSVDDKSLDRSLWILKNIVKIRLAIKIFFAVIILIEIYIFSVNLRYLIISGDQYTNLYNQTLANQNFSVFDKYLKEISPAQLTIKDFGSVKGYGDDYYDFYAFVENTNENYKLTSLTYHFEYNSGLKTDTQTTSLNPKASKYLFIRGIFSDVEFKDSKLVLDNESYKLLSKVKQIKNAYKDTKVPLDCESKENNVNSSNIKITTNRDSKLNISINTLNFTVTNNSLYDYNIVNTKILFLDDNNKIVGISEKEIYQLKTGESKNINFNLSQNLQGFKSISIVPEVDMCSEDSYMDETLESRGI